MPWVVLAVVVWVVGLLAVPQGEFRRLVPFGILAGFGLAMLVNILGSSIFGLWGFAKVSWPILGIPFWAFLAWIPSVILFVYYLPGPSLPRLGWLLLFPATYTAVDFLFIQQGLRFFSPDWNLAYDFLLSLGIHLFVLSWYLSSTPLSQVSAATPQGPASPAPERAAASGAGGRERLGPQDGSGR